VYAAARRRECGLQAGLVARQGIFKKTIKSGLARCVQAAAINTRVAHC